MAEHCLPRPQIYDEKLRGRIFFLGQNSLDAKQTMADVMMGEPEIKELDSKAKKLK